MDVWFFSVSLHLHLAKKEYCGDVFVNDNYHVFVREEMKIYLLILQIELLHPVASRTFG
jgi:hypothetical protein